MFAKSLIAATAIAASAVAFAPAEANAKTHWDINIGVGIPAYPIYDEPSYVYDPVVPVYRVRPQVRYRYVAPDYDYVDRSSCREGASAVRDAGFRSVDAYDCSAPTYGYTAYRHGDLFKVRVNTSGDIVSVRQID